MEKINVRNESRNDYRIVENLTREAFWNLHVPGCNEHYLVHVMREHNDFIPELDFVAETEGKIVGNIVYTKAKLVDENGCEKIVLTFGPFSILPEYQRKGIGKLLLNHSFKKAMELGYDCIVIFGHPGNYVSSGFKSCKKYNVCIENDYYPTAMLVKELKTGVLDGRKWTYYESPVYETDEKEAEKFDQTFEPKEKEYRVSQEEFYIYSHSSIK
ncbi:GNAT family N-acetyltransferase [Roseburia sp. 499]|uniref:GNAT family N-acetyltransferase n=1 Tax=Roseburia sp. 499 TaxID=1261634 RepID=UPI000952EC3F|nr:N-acetyltransferase [Roseburia sp. 499]WVK68886.1 N-acetyltransferase [Roseburia sp. 499]